MTVIENQTFDMERALYGICDTEVRSCKFDGPADGESAFKECSKIKADGCYFNLRYPFWHDTDAEIVNCEMTELCRAALWYSADVRISGSQLHGIKALRECRDVTLTDCDIVSPEFGWSTAGIRLEHCSAQGEYMFMRASELHFRNFRMKGKYSFQYIENAVFEDCEFDTKDAFWHAKNVTVKNCTVKGEYLAWYCENVTFDHCRIIGTQPLCYCKGLKLIDCEMIDTDLSFEKSDVMATVTNEVISIKNPASGIICAPSAGEIIRDDPASEGKIVLGGKTV